MGRPKAGGPTEGGPMDDNTGQQRQQLYFEKSDNLDETLTFLGKV